jgi:hypothetical protein
MARWLVEQSSNGERTRTAEAAEASRGVEKQLERVKWYL